MEFSLKKEIQNFFNREVEGAEKIKFLKVSKEKLKEMAFGGAMAEDRSVAILAKYFYKNN